jgi:valyl-tRNA synthetase
MPTEIPKHYEPKQAQTKWYSFWEEHGYFDANPNSEKEPHTIMIPLPNVTGALHMGHALNGTVQDLITRWKRMQGYEALWMPGTDHAGIATQAVVERRMLEEEGLTRHDIGREALVNRIWKWKDAYEDRILNQLKQLGASCDWRRTRFTLDELCSKAVRRTFFKLFKDSLIYRGKRLVNWDTFLQTAVANDEVFHEEVNGNFWTFTYPVVGSDETIAFSTTRPETMLGDTAVCVHPSDERYKHLVGKSVRLPFDGREISIIADALLAKMEMGTGAVKVTPAHDPNDYACGLRNNLEMINILNPDGTLNENGGKYAGMDRLQARDLIVEDMKAAGHFVEVEERKIELAHSDRSKTPIEPYLSDQWFVKMDELAQSAMDAVEDKRVRFFPSRYAKTYLDWLGEKRDWCISRQLWWGHRIPIWSQRCRASEDAEIRKKMIENDKDFDPELVAIQIQDGGIPEPEKVEGTRVTVAFPQTDIHVCVADGCEIWEKKLEEMNFTQDEDVLDTWFSSQLWPQATLGWPDLDHNPPLDETVVAKQTANPKSEIRNPKSGNAVLDYFYPGSVLITSRDIITLWVARMVLAGLYNKGDVPFRHVCIHPKILDSFGQGMSKSKGNGVDPMELIDKYGADAVRFTIAALAGETQDVRLPIGYECPHCETVIPQELKHQKAKPDGGKKPTVKCPKCKQESQFSSPSFEPDAGEPVARMVSERFEYGRNFCNKLWNASRFAILNLEGYTPEAVAESDLQLEDRWILSRLSAVTAEINMYLGRYQLDAATRAIREFTWNEFCDWYLEMIKPRLQDDNRKPVAQRVLVSVLDALLRLLQPFTPFICEELWQRLKELAPERGLPDPMQASQSVMIASWPEFGAEARDEQLEARFDQLQEMIAAVRNVRAVYNIASSTPLKLYVSCADELAEEIQDVSSQFDNLAKTMLEAVGAGVERPSGSAAFTIGEANGYIPLEGVIDREAELKRQRKKAEEIQGHITSHEKKLANEKFISKAPENVVNDVRETLAGLKSQLESLQKNIDALSDD